MEYANKDKESVARIDKEKKNPKGAVSFVDNRSEFTTQAKFIEAVQRVPDNVGGHVAQRNPIGSRGGEDNDRDKITVSDYDDKKNLTVKQGGRIINKIFMPDNRTFVTDSGSKLLKHYMVVKNGTSYQLPVKHLHPPTKIRGKFAPNSATAKQDIRGHQPEGFGGNQDWDAGLVQDGQINIAASRDATLRHEYREESGGRVLGDDARVASSKYFDADWGVGTMSVVSTDNPLDFGTPETPTREGFTQSPPSAVDHYGEAEMAGTITIDCSDISVSEGVEKVEETIGLKIMTQRNALLGDAAPVASPFAETAGILSHLVTMIAEDLIEEKEAKGKGKKREFPPLTPTAAAAPAPTTGGTSTSSKAPTDPDASEE